MDEAREPDGAPKSGETANPGATPEHPQEEWEGWRPEGPSRRAKLTLLIVAGIAFVVTGVLCCQGIGELLSLLDLKLEP